MSSERSGWRRAALPAAALALVVAMVAGRVVYSSRVEWREAERKLQAADVPGAIDHFGRAARLYAPGNPWSARSFARLEEMARSAETAGRRAQALDCWRELRSAILATRGLYTPHADQLSVANRRIAALSAALESPSLDPEADEAARAAWHLRQLQRDDAPSVPWTLAALSGLALWIGAALALFFYGLDERERIRAKAGVLFAAGIAAGFALFLLGLSRA